MTALTRQLENTYRKAFRNCDGGREVFHMQRKIQSEIQRRVWFVGTIAGQKHKHLLQYKAHSDLAAERTMKEY